MTELKHCPRCGQDKPLDKFSRDRRRADGRQTYCKDCAKSYASAPERVLAKRQWEQANRDKRKEYRDRGQRKHDETRNKRLKEAVFGHYGWTCACCGTTERLCIDHIDGNGRAHRDELFGRGGGRVYGYEFYRWLIKNGFPEGFQTLCKPCNSSKWTGKSCRLDHSAGKTQR